MERQEIVARVNQLMYNELFTYDDIKFELDDAINEINNILQSTYPSMSSRFLYQDSKYLREVIDNQELPEKHIPQALYLYEGDLWYKPPKEELKKWFKNLNREERENIVKNKYWIKVPESFKEIFPLRYIQTVVIPYVVQAMFKRLDEFGHSYSQFRERYEDGLITMFRDFHEEVPFEFQNQSGGYITAKGVF